MGINIKPKTDYSSLFQGLGSSNGSANLNFISDYVSIKNGSYGKLMKAYYAKDGNTDLIAKQASKKLNTSVSEDDAKTITNVERSAEALKSTADKMLDVDFDDEGALDKVKDFVKDYNTLIDYGTKSSSDTLFKKVASLDNLTVSNTSSLNKIGINIGDDGKLTLDEEAFASSDKSTAKSLFNGQGSYAYSVSSQAMMIDYQANYEGIKASSYTSSGSFSSANLSGSLFDSMF